MLHDFIENARSDARELSEGAFDGKQDYHRRPVLVGISAVGNLGYYSGSCAWAAITFLPDDGR